MNSDLFRGSGMNSKVISNRSGVIIRTTISKRLMGEYDKFMAVTLQRYPGRREQISRWADDWYAALGLPVGQPAEPG